MGKKNLLSITPKSPMLHSKKLFVKENLSVSGGSTKLIDIKLV